jgi:hypothetical protein
MPAKESIALADDEANELALQAGIEEILAAAGNGEIGQDVLADLLAHELAALHKLMLRLSAASHNVLGWAEIINADERAAGQPESDSAAADVAAARLIGGASRLMETVRQGLAVLARLRPEAQGEGIWLALTWMDGRCSDEELQRRIAATRAARAANDPPRPKPSVSPTARDLRALAGKTALELADELRAREIADLAADERCGVAFLSRLYAHELATSHGLMMRLGGAADRGLDRAVAARKEPAVSLQLSGVVARLGDRFRRGVVTLQRLSGGSGGPDKIAGLVWGGPDGGPSSGETAPANDALTPAASAGHGVQCSDSDGGAAPCGRPSSPQHGRPHEAAPASDPVISAGHGVDPSETADEGQTGGNPSAAA